MGKYAITDLEKLKKMRESTSNSDNEYAQGFHDGIKAVAQSDCILSPEETEQKFKEVFEKGHEKGWEDGWEEVGNFDLHWDEFKTKL